MNFTSYKNFQKMPFALHPDSEFLMVSKSPDWVADYLDENWELCALARKSDDGSSYWIVGLPVHLAEVFGGFSR